MKTNDSMELILERWDRFVLLENNSLDSYKKNLDSNSKLIDLVIKTTDAKKLKTFATFAFSDEQVLEAAKEILNLIAIIKKSNKSFNPTKLEEVSLQDLVNQGYLKAQQFANSRLGKLMLRYGPGIVAVAGAALYANGNINADELINIFGLSKGLIDKDEEKIINNILDLAGLGMPPMPPGSLEIPST